MAYSIEIINTICTDLGGTGGHKFEVDALNEICTLLGGTGGHTYNTKALAEICSILGYDTTGYKYNIEYLNAIVVGGTYQYKIDAWVDIQQGSLLNYYKYNLPATFGWQLPINIQVDARGSVPVATTDYDVTQHKNAGGTQYYVNRATGNAGYNGLTPATAKLSINDVIDICDSGDTINVAAGFYERASGFAGNILTKSLNIIGTGNVCISTADRLTYTKTAGQTYVYQSTRSGVEKVIECDANLDFVKTYPLVASIDACDALEGSWYTSGGILYVHATGGGSPVNGIVQALLDVHCLYISANVANQKNYLEGLKLYGGTLSALYATNTPSCLNPIIAAKNCKFSNNSSSSDAVHVQGYESYFDNCIAEYGILDGFNYHVSNGVVPKALEINCKGRYNGIALGDSNNGSTIHDGGHAIRINCEYHHNNGGNVADVNDGTDSINVCCYSHDSTSVGDYTSLDFASQANAMVMWLERCYTEIGVTKSASVTNIFNNAGTVYAHRCIYTNSSGTITVT